MRISHVSALIAALALPVAVFAQTQAAPSAAPTPAVSVPALSTVAAALKAKDDTKVVLEGQIVRKIDDKYFEFKDATGMMKVDIDKKHMPAKGFEPNAKVRLTGEVGIKKSGVEMEVKKVEVLG